MDTTTENLKKDAFKSAFKKHPYVLKHLLKCNDIEYFSLYKIKILSDLYTKYKNEKKYIKIAIHEYNSVLSFYKTLLEINNNKDVEFDFYNMEINEKIDFLKEYKIKYELYEKEQYLLIYPESFEKVNLLAKNLWCISRNIKSYNHYKLNDDNTLCIACDLKEGINSFNGITITKNNNFIAYNKKNKKKIPDFICKKLKIKGQLRTLEEPNIVKIIFIFYISLPIMLNVPILNFLILSVLLVFILMILEMSLSIRVKAKEIFMISLLPIIISTIIVQDPIPYIEKATIFHIEKPFLIKINNPLSYRQKVMSEKQLSELYNFESTEDGLNFLNRQDRVYRFNINNEQIETLYSNKGYHEYLKFFINQENALTDESTDYLMNLIMKNADVNLWKVFSLVYDNKTSLRNLLSTYDYVHPELFVLKYNSVKDSLTLEEQQEIMSEALFKRLDIYSILSTQQSVLNNVDKNK
jgi:hypothetical protein